VTRPLKRPPKLAARAVRDVRRAIAYQRLVETEGYTGRSAARLRQRIQAGEFDATIPEQTARDMIVDIDRIEVGHMPPNRLFLKVLVDALCFRMRASTRAAVWPMIGITAAAGKSYLQTGHRSVTWPIWFTLREAALGRRGAGRGKRV
jgi:hypothetical protein